MERDRLTYGVACVLAHLAAVPIEGVTLDEFVDADRDVKRKEFEIALRALSLAGIVTESEAQWRLTFEGALLVVGMLDEHDRRVGS